MVHDGATILQLVDFVTQNYKPYTGQERQIEKIIKECIKYRTADYGTDEKGIVYAVRFTILEGCEEGLVNDLIIRKDYRNKKGLIKYIIARCWTRFPHAKRIKFLRVDKYPYRKEKVYDLIRFFRKGEKHGGRSKTGSTYAASGSNGRTERG